MISDNRELKRELILKRESNQLQYDEVCVPDMLDHLLSECRIHDHRVSPSWFSANCLQFCADWASDTAIGWRKTNDEILSIWRRQNNRQNSSMIWRLHDSRPDVFDTLLRFCGQFVNSIPLLEPVSTLP